MTAFHQSNRDGSVVEYNGFGFDPHTVCRETPLKRLPNGTTFCSDIAKWGGAVRKENFPVDGAYIFSMFYRRDVY
jgi:hypothetical protein